MSYSYSYSYSFGTVASSCAVGVSEHDRGTRANHRGVTDSPHEGAGRNRIEYEYEYEHEYDLMRDEVRVAHGVSTWDRLAS